MKYLILGLLVFVGCKIDESVCIKESKVVSSRLLTVKPLLYLIETEDGDSFRLARPLPIGMYICTKREVKNGL